MKMRRLTVSAVALVALAGLSACGDDSTPASTGTGDSGSSAAATTTAAAAPAGAQGELVAAAQKSTASTGKVKVATTGVEMSGSYDTPGDLVEINSEVGGSGGIVVRRIGNDLYFKATGAIASSYSGNGKKWLHIDASTKPATSTLSLEQNDPASAAKNLATTIADVEETGDGKYAGTLDLTKSPTIPAGLSATMKEKYQAIPFTAEVTDGYLTKLTMDMASVAQGAGKTVTTYSGFGTPVDIAAPAAGQVQEMSSADIKKMGG